MLEPPSSTDEQAQIAQLQALVLARETEIMARDAEIKERERYIRLLEEALRLMRAEKYGASREKLAEAPGQRGLFNEAEAAMEIFEAVDFHPSLDATPLREDKEPAKSPGRKALPAHLPRIEVRHELPALERVCGCGSAMTEMGAETSEQLDYIPAKIQVIRHVRPKYACSHCHTGVKIAPVPAQLIPRSNVSARMAAHLITSKFVDGQPFYRLETVLARHDIAMPRGTQAAVAINAHTPVIPLMNLMDERMRTSGYIRIWRRSDVLDWMSRDLAIARVGTPPPRQCARRHPRQVCLPLECASACVPTRMRALRRPAAKCKDRCPEFT